MREFPDEVRREWGQQVRQRRGPMNQTTLAALAFTDQGTISKLENGTLSPSDDLKWRIAAVLGATVGEVFPYPNVRPPFPELREEQVREEAS